MDLIRRDVLECGAPLAHRHVERKAPDRVVAHGLLPLRVPKVTLHQRELVTLGCLDDAVEAVETLAVVILGDLLAAVLVADEDQLLALLGLGLLARCGALISGIPLCLLRALLFQHLLKAHTTHVRNVAHRLQVGLVLLAVVVRLVEVCEKPHPFFVFIVLPALEYQLARAALGMVRAVGAVEDGLCSLVEA